MSAALEVRVTRDEIVALLRQILAQPHALKLAGRSWDDIFAGEVEFTFCGWNLSIFNDCDGLDYVDEARAPDGRVGDFDDWVLPDSLISPLDDLSSDEFRQLEAALKAATI